MNRRTQGKVKQAQRRAQKRRDIRAGRVLSMQQLMHNTAHQHDHVEESVISTPEPMAQEPLGDGDYELVLKGDDGEEIVARGTQYAMRKRKQEEQDLLLNGGVPYTFSVRKVKVAA